REETSRLPLEADLRAALDPRGRCTPPLEDVDDLFVEVALGYQLSPRRDLADVGIVGPARPLHVDEDAAPATAGPGLDLHRSQVLHVKAPDDRDALRFLPRSEEHTSELQSRRDLVCRLLLEKKKKY